MATIATLGGLIKDYRIQKRLSQLEVSLRIGWQDTTRLSKIEQGRVGKPTRGTIEKIIKALELNDSEKGEFLFIGGYLPTEEEIIKIRKKTEDILNNWPYPATLFDFSWRVINENKANSEIYQTNTNHLHEEIIDKHLRVLDILLNPKLIQNRVLKGEALNKWHVFLSEVIAQFGFEQRNRTKDKWYISHLKELLKNDLFRQLRTPSRTILFPEIIVGKYTTKSLANPKKPTETLNFHLFIVPVLEDLRFEIELLVPQDLGTYSFYNN